MRVRFRPLAEVAEIFIGLPTKISHAQGGNSTAVLSVRALGERGIDDNELIRADITGRNVEGYCVRSGDVVLPAAEQNHLVFSSHCRRSPARRTRLRL